MTVKEFIEGYNKQINDDAKTKFIEKHIVTDYVNYEEKIVLCKNVINASTYVLDENGSYSDIIKFNTPTRYMLYTLTIIDTYTDIDVIEKDNNLINFNILNKNGLINVFFEAISQSEIHEFSTILNMILDDIRDNEFSVDNTLYNIRKTSTNIINLVLSIINELDEEQIKELINNNIN